MSDRKFAGLTLEELRDLQLPAAISHSGEDVAGAVFKPEVAWFDHLQRLDSIQAVVRALPELLDEIERLNRAQAANAE